MRTSRKWLRRGCEPEPARRFRFGIGRRGGGTGLRRGAGADIALTRPRGAPVGAPD